MGMKRILQLTTDCEQLTSKTKRVRNRTRSLRQALLWSTFLLHAGGVRTKRTSQSPSYYRSARVAACRCNRRKLISILRRYPEPACRPRDDRCLSLWCRQREGEPPRRSSKH